MQILGIVSIKTSHLNRNILEFLSSLSDYSVQLKYWAELVYGITGFVPTRLQVSLVVNTINDVSSIEVR